MQEIIRYFKKRILTTYGFHLMMSIFVTGMCLLLYSKYDLARLGFIFASMWLCLTVFLYVRKLKILEAIVEEDEDKQMIEYKMIDSAVFTQQAVYAYSFNKMVKMIYDEIMIVCHVDNIWEKTRPGYKGNHKIIIKNDDSVIQVAVKNEQIADCLMNYLATKNPKASFEHAPATFETTSLNMLENWQVSGRF